MKRFRLVTLVALFLFTVLSVAAQDKLQFSYRISNNEAEHLFEGLVSSEYTQGGTITGDFQVFKKDSIRLGVSGQYARKSYGTASDFYGVGPSLSVDAGKVVSVRGAAHFGATTTYSDDKTFTRRYEVGPRLNLGRHLFLDPFVLTFTKQEGFGSPAERGYEFGGGLRF